MNLLAEYLATFNRSYLNRRDRGRTVREVATWLIILAGVGVVVVLMGGGDGLSNRSPFSF